MILDGWEQTGIAGAFQTEKQHRGHSGAHLERRGGLPLPSRSGEEVYRREDRRREVLRLRWCDRLRERRRERFRGGEARLSSGLYLMGEGLRYLRPPPTPHPSPAARHTLPRPTRSPRRPPPATPSPAQAPLPFAPNPPHRFMARPAGGMTGRQIPNASMAAFRFASMPG